jgi:hypothetical protein
MAQVGTGFVSQGPLDQLGLVHSRSNDGLGLGVLWSQPSARSGTVFHENEFGLEATYVLQLTPTANCNPTFKPSGIPLTIRTRATRSFSSSNWRLVGEEKQTIQFLERLPLSQRCEAAART